MLENSTKGTMAGPAEARKQGILESPPTTDVRLGELYSFERLNTLNLLNLKFITHLFRRWIIKELFLRRPYNCFKPQTSAIYNETRGEE
jgi:hypothetical protein